MITSTANRQIKNVIQLQKRAKERRKQGAFVMEGPRMVAETPVDLLREIYVSERFLPDRDPETAAKLREWEHLGCGEIVTVSESVFAHMSDTATPWRRSWIGLRPICCSWREFRIRAIWARWCAPGRAQGLPGFS